MPRVFIVFIVLGLGLIAVCFGAILTRVAQNAGAPSLVIATCRMGLAALCIVPLALLHGRTALRQMTSLQWRWAGLAGMFLALHFITWTTSLQYTSVASSTALVTTNPLWVGLFAYLLGQGIPSRTMICSIILALLGSACIFWSDSTSAAGRHPVLGNMLAVAGSWCFSAYLVTGRRLRVHADMPLSVYICLTYGTAALSLLMVTVLTHTPLHGYSSTALAAMLGLALVPQLIGHSAYNWALPHVSATFIAVVTLGEPIGSALLAYCLFDEHMLPLQAAGFALLLVGICFAVRAETASRPARLEEIAG